jgi:glucose-6-phosphate isomerase
MSLIKIDLTSTGLMQRKLASGKSLQEALTALATQNGDAHARLMERRHAALEPLGWLDLPLHQDYAEQCLQIAASLHESCAELIVCGIGGSALGIQAVYSALDWPVADLDSLYVLDNVDPSQIASLADSSPLLETAINVISKSGTTIETMSGFFYLLSLMAERGLSSADINSRIVATTDPESGVLRPLAQRRGWKTLPVPPDVGGRFSVLSPVGLLPLAFAGVDIKGLLAGAAQMQIWLAGLSTQDNPAWQLAAVHYLLESEGIAHTLHYTYGDPLILLGDWFRQLWAESLGKSTQLDGSPAHGCMTPIVARGTTDQHSQNQLYMDGPDNKLYGIIGCEKWDLDPLTPVPDDEELAGEKYYDGTSFGSLLSASRDGVRDALIERGRPVYQILFPELRAQTIGAYLQLWMLATAYAGMLYNVNAFDQPGVERSKALTKQRLPGAKT